MLRVVVSGGGTGGHVYPAIAVAGGIRERFPDAAILFVGTRRGLEATAVPKAGFEIAYVHARGLASHPLKLAHALFDNALGTAEALGKLRGFRPAVVVGSGGYVSLPVGAAAQTMGIPTVLLEQNVVPGKATKFLSGRATKVCASFDSTIGKLDHPEKAVVTGNPVRRDILERTRADGRARMGVPEDAFCLLVTGASQGARSVNEAVVAALPSWKERPWQVIHLTGEGEFASVKGRAEGAVEGGLLKWRGMAFCDDMASAYAAADVVVARAGATTMAELTCRGLPAILVPYPHAGAHQVDNARWLEARGGSVTILNEDALACVGPAVVGLAEDAERRARMAEASRAAGHPDAVERIVDEVASAAGMRTVDLATGRLHSSE
ncbi:MAG: undecaprenyldiphospho-muramoylpentapeptide beta-N-acetylglucosaminyltransferase [Armatimonadetes bacterium]|nr:undecaprenyldiphospho-muramoylpentapeptide beta-N-acetylglucosaminyltransferase [Armatimonadota bacterium]